VQEQAPFIDDILAEVGKVVVGQRAMIEGLLIGLFTDGHVLLEGVPGLAKTLTIKTLADVIQASFQRIQFTPDLLPADLIGTLIYHPDSGEFRARKGPVFANLILADEINRAPAKVQSALLEAMQERQVTLGDETHPLPNPFLVLATQNPIEQEGTYPLPEAQVDRFMLKLRVGYPKAAEELEIMDRMTEGGEARVRPLIAPEDVTRLRGLVRQIYMDERVKSYIVALVLASREPGGVGLDRLESMIAYGASPRATIYLNLASRAHAFLHKRGYVTPDDVKAVAPDVLRHRILVTYEAEAEETTSDDIVRELLGHVEVP